MVEHSSASRIEVWIVDLAQAAGALLATEMQVPRLPEADRARILGAGCPEAPAAHQRLAAHVALRIVLEHVFGPVVRQRPFDRTAAGRPSLAGIAGDFSLAHTGGVALIGVARSGRVGVDLERPRRVAMTPRRRAVIEAAARHLAADAALPGDRRTEESADRRLLAAWVRLEAYAKARGVTMARLLTAIGALGSATSDDDAMLAARLASLAEDADGAAPRLRSAARQRQPVSVHDLSGLAGAAEALQPFRTAVPDPGPVTVAHPGPPELFAAVAWRLPDGVPPGKIPAGTPPDAGTARVRAFPSGLGVDLAPRDA